MKISNIFSGAARFFLILTGLLICMTNGANAASRFLVASGNWNSSSVWSSSAGGSTGASVPVSGDVVYIQRNFTVTINITNAACATIYVGTRTTGYTGTGTILFSSASSSLTVSAAAIGGSRSNSAGYVDLSNGGNFVVNNNVVVGGSSSSSPGSIIFGANGNMTVNGILTLGTTNNYNTTIDMTNGGTLTVQGLAVGSSGSMTWRSGTGRVVLTATNTLPPSVFTTFNNLTISSGTTTLGANTTNITGDFTNNGTFSHNNKALIFNGTAPQTIDGTSPTTFYSLTLDNSNGLTQNVSSTVNYSLILTSGRFSIGDFDLNIGLSGTISGTFDANNMIVTNGTGKVVKALSTTSFTFPVGTGTTDYTPLTLSSLAGYSGKSVGVSVVNGKHPSNASSTFYLNRYWSINPSTTGITAVVTTSFLTSDLAGGDVTKVAAGRYFSTGLPTWAKYSVLSGTTLTTSSAINLGSNTTSTCITGITLADPSATINYNPGQNLLCGTTLTMTAAPVGDSPFTYLWTNNSETTDAITPSTSALGSFSGSLTVTDANGFTCNSGYSYTVNAIQVDATLGTSKGYYSTLRAAFESINNGTHQGVIVAQIGYNTTETATAVLNANGSGSANYSSLLLYPTNPDITVSSSTINGPLVSLYGADNVTINGSLLQTNAYPVLTFLNSNTGASASTILFSQDACNNTISYCKLKGQGASANTGIIHFSVSAPLGTGNDGNTISNNWITGTGSTSATRPFNAILSSGTLTRDNSNNTISNNRIYNFFNNGNESSGIRLDANSTDFTISGNSIYGESALIPAASVIYRAIYLNNTSGVFTVLNNYIGGSGPFGTGTWTKTNVFNNEFYGIYLNASNTTASSIQGNVIRNIAYSNSANATWAGIYVNAGKARIGTTVGDTIGNGVGTGSIVVTNTTTGGSVYGIYINSTDSVYIQNNVLGSITAANATAENSTHLFGIYKADVAGALIVNSNKIGGSSTPNSLLASSAATNNNQYVMGLYSGSTTSSLVQGNEISNLTNNTSGYGFNFTRGMRINGGMDGSLEGTGGSNSILDNIVHDITSFSGNGNNYVNTQLVGIDLISTKAGTTQLIRGNNIYNLINTINDVKIEMYGIFYRGPSDASQIIDRNFVRTFVIVSNTAAYLHGISVETGACKVTNNVVYLGNNITTGCSIWGLWTNSPNLMEFYHNTVYLSGVASSGSSNSFALRDLASGPSIQRIIQNNILWNDRYNSNIYNVSHYALYLGGGGAYTIDYNDYQYHQQFARIGASAYSSFTPNWVSGLDAHSLSVDPLLTNLGGVQGSDYQPGISLNCPKIPTELYDFGYSLRPETCTMGAWEYVANPVEIWINGIRQNTYPTLKTAFDAINAGTYTGGLYVKIVSNTNETAPAVLYQSGYNNTSSYSYVTICPTRTEIQVKGALNSPLVELDGADNVRFDGRANLTGSTAHLMLINTSTDPNASTLRFINSAESDTIQYCYLKGSSSSATSGIVVFSTATSGNGNDNNIISNCLLTNPGTTSTARTINAIYSSGSVGFENSGVVISNNLFYDFRILSSSSNGILVSSNSSDFTITGNSFYQTATMNISAGLTLRAISIDNTNGNNFTISGNYIGGTAQLCQGARLDIGTMSKQAIVFQPIYLNVGTLSATSVQGNTIANFKCVSTSLTPFVGIYLDAGRFNVGSVSGNVIGASTGTGNIVLTDSLASLAESYGIFINTTGVARISNNTVGSITTSNVFSTIRGHSFYGIYKPNVAGNTTISNNVVGSLTSAQNIYTSNASTTDGQELAGIYCYGNGNTPISGNTVANLRNASTRNSATNSVYGIWMSNSGTARDSIYQNFVYTLTSGATSTSDSYSAGIFLTAGSLYVVNNIVVLEFDASNSNFNRMAGIVDAGATNSNNQIFHNTSFIKGGIANAKVVSAFYKPTNSGISDLRNNILGNIGSTSNKTFTLYFGNSSGAGTLTLNYNDYYRSGSVIAFYQGFSDNTLPIVAGMDANSVLTNPLFTNPNTIDRTGYRQTVDLYGTALNVITDHGSYTRSLTSPCMGAWERINKWKGGTSTNFNISGNWTFNQVPSPGDNVIFDDVPLRPCLMDQERTVNNIVNAQSAYRFILNGYKLNLLGQMAFSNGAQMDASETGSTLSFAGTSAQSIPTGALYNNTVYNMNLNTNSNVLLNGGLLHIRGALSQQSTGRLDVTTTPAHLYFEGTSTQEIPAAFFKDDKVYNLTINNSSNVMLSGTLKLLNQLAVTAGRLDANTNSPTFQYEGSTAQTLEPNCFLGEQVYNLTSNNSVGLTLNSSINVNNNMGIHSGTVSLPETKTLTVVGTLSNSVGNNGLLLNSSLLGTASLIAYNSGVAATMKRYVDGDTSAWHFLSSPMAAQPISGSWIPAGTHGDGTGYDLYAWDEPSSCWVYNLNLTEPTSWPAAHPESYFVPGRGYLYALQELHPTKTFAGNLNAGDITRAITVRDVSTYQGFNLLGNPYPSSIDWSLDAGFSRGMLYSNGGGYDIWTWSTTANNYGVYNSADADGIGTNNVTRYIAPMQAFFVLASSAGSFTFKNASRVHNGASAWLKSARVNDVIQNVRLSVASSAGQDEVKLGFGYAANENGAQKLFSPVETAPSLYMNSHGVGFSTRRLTDTNTNKYVAVNFKAGETGVYTLRCTYDPVSLGTIYLQDCLTGTILDLSGGESYTFRAAKGDAPERFVLHFGEVTPVDSEIHPKVMVRSGILNVYLENMIGDFRVRVTNLQGRVIYTKKMSGGEQCSVGLFGRGIYLVTVDGWAKMQTIKAVY